MIKNERGSGSDMPRNIRDVREREKPSLHPAAWAGGWAVLVALPLWLSSLAAVWLGAAALGALLWTWGAVRARGAGPVAAGALLWLAVGLGVGVQARLGEIARDWPRLHGRIEERAARELNAALDELVQRGVTAVDGVAAAAATRPAGGADRVLFRRVGALRNASGVTALALFDGTGVPLAWAGEHRGTIPLPARLGDRRYVYNQGPLFSYLYITRGLPGGKTAVAAVLLEAALDGSNAVEPFANGFARRFGLTPRFCPPARSCGEAVWDWATDRSILSVSFAALTQQHWWERVVGRGRAVVTAAGLLALLLLSLLWFGGRAGAPGMPVLIATLGGVLSPVGEIVGREELFSPMSFVLPAPGDVTLGTALVVLVGAGVWLLTRLGGARVRRPLPLRVQLLLTAPLLPAVVAVVERSASPGLLAAHEAGGYPLQLAATLLVALPLYAILRASRRTGRPRSAGLLLAGGVLLSAVPAVGLVVAWRPGAGVLPWSALVWIVPVALVAAGLRGFRVRRGPVPLLLAVWLAGSLVLPHLWILHTRSDLERAERELARLGTEPDPFLAYLLGQFAMRAGALAAEGTDGVNLLYHSWVASDLAREGYEGRLTLWRDGDPETELPLTDADSLPRALRSLVTDADSLRSPAVRLFTGIESLHYLLLAPLPDGRLVSVAVPPRRQVGRTTALTRFLRPATVGRDASDDETLFLVPAGEVDSAADPAVRAGRVLWTRTAQAWRAEARARFPAGLMHAHLFVRTASVPLVMVRGVLAAVALLATALLLWLVARALCGELHVRPLLRRGWIRSFRGRLTVALLLFFLFPTVLFGAAAYSAVAREVLLSAAGQARRALEQAAPEVEARGITGQRARTGADLLVYRRGLLVASAAPEVLDLGLFHSWLPPEVYLRFARAEIIEAEEDRRLGENEYLVAYRRLGPELALAAPIPLAAGEITRRQREFRDIALLVSLLGAGLSVVLAFLVGRALSRPLAELTRAAATVGGGDLRVRLPERPADEFGSVYRSFNRMVRGLREARGALAREARRTEAIVTEAATGVLALDADGRVELVNPRAAEVLGTDLERGQPLRGGTPVVDVVRAALEAFRASGALEDAHEVDVDGRIVRLRFRRLTGVEGSSGTVVSLEDVTAEIGTARVLAWGEMARQVAHEIKNPLTPIKLSVQHLRRAFADQRPDFGAILERNAEVMLREIDRLGEIARAFARFGTPQQSDAGLDRVDVGAAVRETLALYRSGGDDIRFRAQLPAAPGPFAVARGGELKEVLVNLLENARDATANGGEVVVSTAAEARGVVLAVTDTGEGIAPDLLPRIFEPRFSTRTSGTGLGLAIVRRLVESWGGEVQAESDPGIGTRIRVIMRVADEAGTSIDPSS